jgi:hypothetical protein
MFEWLYDIFVSIVSFVLSLFGMSLDKRGVELMGNQKEESSTPSVPEHASDSAQLP